VPKTKIEERIRRAYTEVGMSYTTLRIAVFPPKEWPRAWRYALHGGPPGCDRVLRVALRRYGYTVSRFCGDERVIGGPPPSRLEKFSQSLQRRGRSR
jgi:hypothetical protein